MSIDDTLPLTETPAPTPQGGVHPRRRPELGGYARGEETRNRIIIAALNAFGADGYTRASTRKIAADAGVNPPALQYYFDSKEGLHRACAQYIIDRFSAVLAPSLARAAVVLQGADRTEALDLICDMLDVIVDASLDPEAINWKPFMARAQADGAGPAYPLIRDQIASPLHTVLARLVAAATGGRAEDEVVRVRTAVIMSQMSAFNINRQSTLKLLCWPDFSGDRLALLKATLRLHTRGALLAPVD
ncbi:MAG: CerR family C-terminal domain-containing protein [Caulobacteraceae bacterium]